MRSRKPCSVSCGRTVWGRGRRWKPPSYSTQEAQHTLNRSKLQEVPQLHTQAQCRLADQVMSRIPV